jgi:hypothetical protein
VSTDEKLDEVLLILRRMEARQISTPAAVSEIKEHEAPVVGSFATVEPAPDEK